VEVAVTAEPVEPRPLPSYQRRSVDEILADPRIKTVENIHDLAMPGTFESDEELEEFLRFYRDQRRADAL
jgi:hypothetical protein